MTGVGPADVEGEEDVVVWEGAGVTVAGDVAGGAEVGGGERRQAKAGTALGWSEKRVRGVGGEGTEVGGGEVGCAV